MTSLYWPLKATTYKQIISYLRIYKAPLAALDNLEALSEEKCDNPEEIKKVFKQRKDDGETPTILPDLGMVIARRRAHDDKGTVLRRDYPQLEN